jgi:hypothetical protein
MPNSSSLPTFTQQLARQMAALRAGFAAALRALRARNRSH